MGESDHQEFLDLLYAAPFEEALWPQVIERFSDLVGGGGGSLTRQNQATGEGEAIIVRLDEATAEVYFDHFGACNPLLRVENPREFMRSWKPCVFTDEDWMDKEDLVGSEYYNDFLRPRDMHSVLLVRLAARDLDAAYINIGRSQRKGQYGADDIALARRLHPHLIRAFQLGQKFAPALALGRELASALDLSAHGVFLVTGDGRIRHANRAAERLLARAAGLRVVGGRLGAVQTRAAERLRDLIARAASPGDAAGPGGSMTIACPERAAALTVMVAPAPRERPSIFAEGPSVIVTVTDPGAALGPREPQLRDLFGLTRAEARVAMAIFEGATPREASERLGVSYQTVRNQLQTVYEKTGARRQADLVMRLMGVVGGKAQ